MILPRFHHHSDRQNVVLMLILSSTIVLIPTTHYARSSYLLGCFLAGLCFCTHWPLARASCFEEAPAYLTGIYGDYRAPSGVHARGGTTLEEVYV